MKNIISLFLLIAFITLTVKAQENLYSIDGYVYYNSSSVLPISEVTLKLKKTSDNTFIRNTLMTNSSGYFKFDSVPDGKYIIICTTAHLFGGINPADALMVNRNYIRLYTFVDNLKKLAANVNADKYTNPMDALAINRRYIKLSNSFKAGDWLFEQDTITVNGSNITHNIKGLCFGDVNGSYACPNAFECGNDLPDTRDGKSYKTVLIGNQCWMKENLNATSYRNGNPIPGVTDNTAWKNLTNGAYCNYDNDVKNAEIYGRLYNWYAVNDSRNLCPTGWHVPDSAEWKTLIDFLGDESIAGGKMKETTTTHWLSPNEGATNESGFTALPGGYRRYGDGSFYYLWYYGHWWSTKETDASNAWYCQLNYNNINTSITSYYKSVGFSVRCVWDKTTANNSPNKPYNPDPVNGSPDQAIGKTLSWSCIDPDNELLTYDVYFGTNTNPELKQSNIAATTFDPGSLNYNTTYYWKIVARDTHNNTTAGDIWSFKTIDGTVQFICGDNLIDARDSNIYKTVLIGSQCWFKENLRATFFRNGDTIPNFTDGLTWGSLSTGAYCNYDNDTNKANTYGKLYNWFTINESSKLCPEGWHVPTDIEWTALTDYLGGERIAGNKLKEAGTAHWVVSTGATDESGFTALPGGYRTYFDGSFTDIGFFGYWWTATEDNDSNAWARSIFTINSDVSRIYYDKTLGFSVRCLKDQTF